MLSLRIDGLRERFFMTGHAKLEINPEVIKSQGKRVAELSGMRLADCIEVPWSAGGRHAIVWQTNKSRRRTIAIPIAEEIGLAMVQKRQRNRLETESAKGAA